MTQDDVTRLLKRAIVLTLNDLDQRPIMLSPPTISDVLTMLHKNVDFAAAWTDVSPELPKLPAEYRAALIEHDDDADDLCS